GKILRREYVEGPTAYEEIHRTRNTEHDSIRYKFVAKPADYESWSPQRKKKYQQQLARERR
ncbi:MAG: hypothetical protein HYW91_03560, partial [Candidatus Sungbacteria bacterium]|nr:hypothetical protein [Candidatus Sungbacteria bacterium]